MQWSQIMTDLKLNTIHDRFPKQSKLIESLYLKNPSFNSLCHDYIEIAEQVRQNRESDISISEADLIELKKLLNELEQEMILYFEEAHTA